MHVPYWGEQREMKWSMAKKKGNARFQIHLILPSLLSPNSKSCNLKKALRVRTIFQSKWQCWGSSNQTLSLHYPSPLLCYDEITLLGLCKSFPAPFPIAPLKSSHTRAQVDLSAGLLISHAQQCCAVLSYSFYRHGKWGLKETVLIPTSPSNVIPILPFYSFTLGKLFQGHHSSPCSIFLK